ncbi:hypothetical protein HOY82DRAFT_546711 [Tuber indicum]|nr:hypothetical protein HOY82DRAFT_546711 [Tuber indicum]
MLALLFLRLAIRACAFSPHPWYRTLCTCTIFRRCFFLSHSLPTGTSSPHPARVPSANLAAASYYKGVRQCRQMETLPAI